MLRSCVIALMFSALPDNVDADLVSYWNFNSYDGNSATISADNGAGLVILQEEGNAWPAGELDVVPGTEVNVFGTDPAGTALALGNNGIETLTRTLTFGLDTTGFTDLMFSAALAGSNATYDIGLISYSLDGIVFTDTGLSVDPSATGSFELHTADLSGFSILENQSSLFIRLTLSGDNLASSQNLLVDNVQFTATPAAVPEAPTWGLMFVAAGLQIVIGWMRRTTARTAISAP